MFGREFVLSMAHMYQEETDHMYQEETKGSRGAELSERKNYNRS
jgi:hypothetical protein